MNIKPTQVQFASLIRTFRGNISTHSVSSSRFDLSYVVFERYRKQCVTVSIFPTFSNIQVLSSAFDSYFSVVEYR